VCELGFGGNNQRECVKAKGQELPARGSQRCIVPPPSQPPSPVAGSTRSRGCAGCCGQAQRAAMVEERQLVQSFQQRRRQLESDVAECAAFRAAVLHERESLAR
jgi:hypothetical protein